MGDIRTLNPPPPFFFCLGSKRRSWSENPKYIHKSTDRTCITAELKGNQQADEIKAGVGSLGGLKKTL